MQILSVLALKMASRGLVKVFRLHRMSNKKFGENITYRVNLHI